MPDVFSSDDFKQDQRAESQLARGSHAVTIDVSSDVQADEPVDQPAELPVEQHVYQEPSLDEHDHVKKSAMSENHPHRHVDEYSEVMRSLAPSTNMLAAFTPKPSRTHFATQAPNEHIILLLRRHPITQVPWILGTILLAILPIFFDPGSVLSFLPASYQLGVTIIFYGVILTMILEKFITWYYNVYIITDERVIDVDFLSLIYRNITSAKLDNIEDVTAQASGMIQTVIDYGAVKIQTAGTQNEIEFEDVPHPNQVTKLLNEMLLEEEREKVEGRVN